MSLQNIYAARGARFHSLPDSNNDCPLDLSTSNAVSAQHYFNIDVEDENNVSFAIIEDHDLNVTVGEPLDLTVHVPPYITDFALTDHGVDVLSEKTLCNRSFYLKKLQLLADISILDTISDTSNVSMDSYRQNCFDSRDQSDTCFDLDVSCMMESVVNSAHNSHAFDLEDSCTVETVANSVNNSNGKRLGRVYLERACKKKKIYNVVSEVFTAASLSNPKTNDFEGFASMDAVRVTKRNAYGLQSETTTIAERFQAFLNRFDLERRLLVEGPDAFDLASLASLLTLPENAGCGFVFDPQVVQDTSPESNDATLWDDIDVGYLPAAINFVKFDFLNRTGLQKGRFIGFFLPTMLSHMFRAKTWIIDANFRVAVCGFVFHPLFVQDTRHESNDATLWDDIDVG